MFCAANEMFLNKCQTVVLNCARMPSAFSEIKVHWNGPRQMQRKQPKQSVTFKRPTLPRA